MTPNKYRNVEHGQKLGAVELELKTNTLPTAVDNPNIYILIEIKNEYNNKIYE